MKTFGLVVILSFLSISLFAQKPTPRAIEGDLLKSFKNIQYWNKKSSLGYDAKVNDSLIKTNRMFREKLMRYCNNNPIVISFPFQNLRNANLKISTSEDKRLRIYSWDNEQGDFDNVIQYQSGWETKATLFIDTIKKGDEGYVGEYVKLYQLKRNDKTYYLGVYNATYSRTAYGMGVRTLSIESGNLNTDLRMIKTTSGLHNNIYFNYNVLSQLGGKWPEISFDPKTGVLYIPILTEKDRLTNKFITYKFTGQYFEKVK